MSPSKISGHNPDGTDRNTRCHTMQSPLHPRSETTGRPLLRRRRRRHRKSTHPSGKLPAALILVAMSAVMAVLFSLLALFLWRQGVTSFVIFQNLGMICHAPLVALRPPKEGSRNDTELTLRA